MMLRAFGSTAGAPMFAVPVMLIAKGDTVKVTIAGGDLAKPIEITDKVWLAKLNVWSGPGTSTNEPQSLNVDWSQGKVDPPHNVPVYIVSFETTRRNPGTYIVRYAIDPSTKRGYVYFPGRADKEYRDNTWLIYRGVEGNWFRASNEWEKFTHRLIEDAQKAP